MITSHSHSSFTISNPARSVAFYRNILGFTVEQQFEVEGASVEQITALPGAHLKVAHLLLGNFRLELIEYMSPRGHFTDLSTNNVGSAHIAFYTDDIEKTYHELREKGTEFRGAPVTAGPDRPRAAYFLDPDGISLELSEHARAEQLSQTHHQ